MTIKRNGLNQFDFIDCILRQDKILIEPEI